MNRIVSKFLLKYCASTFLFFVMSIPLMGGLSSYSVPDACWSYVQRNVTTTYCIDSECPVSIANGHKEQICLLVSVGHFDCETQSVSVNDDLWNVSGCTNRLCVTSAAVCRPTTLNEDLTQFVSSCKIDFLGSSEGCELP